jgi:hypothetical protein
MAGNVGHGSAVDKRREDMGNKSSLPTKAELAAFIDHLEGATDSSSEDMTALTDTETAHLAADLLVRLEHGVAEMKTNGESVPPTVLETIELLRAHNDKESERIDPHEWIKSLLAGNIPAGRANAPRGLSFRSLRTDLLTDEDREILREMAEEVRADNDNNE